MRILFSAILAALLLTNVDSYAQPKPELVIQTGHFDEIQGMAFSPDGKWLASVGMDKRVIVWDLKTGKQFAALRGHKDKVKMVMFSHDGKKLISAGDSRDNMIIVWDWKAGKIIWEKKRALGNAATALALSNDQKYLATGTYRQFRLWDFNTGKMIYELKGDHNSPEADQIRHNVEDIKFHSDNKTFGMTVYGGVVSHRNILDGKALKFFKNKDHQCSPRALRWKKGKNKNVLICAGPLGNVTEWNALTGQMTAKYPSIGSGNSVPVEITKDAKRIVIGMLGDIQVLDVASQKEYWKLKDAVYTNNKSVTLSHDGKYLALSGEDKNENTVISIFNMDSKSAVQHLYGYQNKIRSLAFSSDGKKLAVGSRTQHARVWDLTTSSGYKNYTEGTWTRGDIRATVQFSPDDQQVLVAHQHTFFAMEVASTAGIKVVRKGINNPGQFKYSQNGKFVITSPPNLYDAKNGYEFVKKLKSPRLQSKSMAFSPDGKRLYGGGYKEILSYNLDSLEVSYKLETKGYTLDITVFNDNKRLLVDDYSDIKVMNAKTGEVIKVIHENAAYPRLSKDNKYIAVVDNKKLETYLYDAVTFTKLKTFKGHIDDITAMEFSPDSKILATGSEDASIILWDIQTGNRIARLLAIGEEDYIMMTPDNYYMTSKNGVNAVAWRIGEKIYPFEQFDLHNNRPDLVLSRIGYADQQLIEAYKRSYEKRLKKMGFAPGSFKREFNLPELKILNEDAIDFNTAKSIASLKIKASDGKYPLDRINVWIDDVPLFGTKGMKISGQLQSIEKMVNLNLISGRNKVQVSVMNKNGVESLKETYEIICRKPKVKPNLYILGIGASKYKQSQFNLTYASKDAQDLINTMKSSGAFASVNSKALLDADVTKEKILSMKSFLAQAGTEDVVIVFIAGHGVLDDKYDYYFATHDMDFNNPASRGIEYSDIESLIDGIKALKKLLFMDTCHSGEIDKDEVEEEEEKKVEKGTVKFRNVGVNIRKKPGIGAYNTSELTKELFTDLRRGTGASVISSSGGAELAMEGDQWNNGLFTYCLIHGLKDDVADGNDDRHVNLSELQNYVVKNVTLLSGGKQVPTSRSENLILDYDLW